MSASLFAPQGEPWAERLSAGAVLLHGWALPQDAELCAEVDAVIGQAPLRGMETPGGQSMSVATSSCGDWGWVSDRGGYRYSASDPQTGQAWPRMPARLLRLAGDAAAAAGFPGFAPDACLINCYQPGARMGLHQDKKIALEHGDVLVWGGEDRMRFHGVQPVKPGVHPLLGARRLNLTFRKAR